MQVGGWGGQKRSKNRCRKEGLNRMNRWEAEKEEECEEEEEQKEEVETKKKDKINRI